MHTTLLFCVDESLYAGAYAPTLRTCYSVRMTFWYVGACSAAYQTSSTQNNQY